MSCAFLLSPVPPVRGLAPWHHLPPPSIAADIFFLPPPIPSNITCQITGAYDDPGLFLRPWPMTRLTNPPEFAPQPADEISGSRLFPSPRTHSAHFYSSDDLLVAEISQRLGSTLAAGGSDNGPPGIREMYHPNYFGAFVLGPDGHNVEAVCHRPET